MKNLFYILILIFSLSLYSAEPPILAGLFKPMGLTPKVDGIAEIYHTEGERDFVVIRDFLIKGGIVLDVKICGDIGPNPPFQNICLSLGNIDEKSSYDEFVIPTSMKIYKTVKIFDADVGVDLAQAVLY